MSDEKQGKPALLGARASELGDLLISGSTGFAVRKRTGVGLFVHFFLLGCMVVLGASLLVHYKSPEGCFLAVLIGGVFMLIARNLERLKKIKQSLEFMNALFSSALGKGYQFCCIVKNTGDVVFFNRPFQTIFPAFVAQSERKFGTLLEVYNVPAAQRDVINGFMSSGTGGTVQATFKEAEAASALNLTVSIEVIDRPTGFFLVRGK